MQVHFTNVNGQMEKVVRICRAGQGCTEKRETQTAAAPSEATAKDAGATGASDIQQLVDKAAAVAEQAMKETPVEKAVLLEKNADPAANVRFAPLPAANTL